MYNKIILEHFKNPRNQGELKDPDGLGEVGNPVCGDMMKMYVKIDRDHGGEERVGDIKFQTYGCGAAIATSSVMTELAKGQLVRDALKITKDDILAKLGGKDTIPVSKFHCSVLATEAFAKAIDDYHSKNKK